jgi:small-conductance mechanosensitive channel
MLTALNFDHLLGLADSSWMLAGAVLIGWIAILLTAKRVIVGALQRAAQRPRLEYLVPILEAISPALTIAIIVAGIGIASQIAPLSPRWQADAGIILTAGIVAAPVVFTDKIAHWWLRREASRYPLFSEGYEIVTGAVHGLIIALGLLMFLESVGISIGPLLASLGIGSLAIALALQETFKNMFSGFFLIADKPLEVGDFVKLESGQEGELFKLGWRSSKFRMLTNEVVVVPNSQLIDSIVINHRAPDGNLAVPVDFAVLNSNDPVHVERVIAEVARDVMGLLDGNHSSYEPQVLFQGVSGNLINLTVLVHTPSSESINFIRNELIKRALARFAREEIKLPTA